MSKNFKKFEFILKNFNEIDQHIINQIFYQNPSTETIALIREILSNILDGNVEISIQQKNKLRRYKKILFILKSQSVTKHRKRNIIKKFGKNFLPILISVINPILHLILK